MSGRYCQLAAASLLAIGCATAARPPAGPTGFSWTNDDLIIADTTVLRPPKGRWPRYPDDERANGGEAGFVAAFVVDTVGHVELPSVSFIGTAAAAFSREVCTYLRRTRFAPIAHRADVAARGLVVFPLVFALQGGTWDGKTLDETPVRDHFRQEGAAAALAEMRAHQDCPP